MKKLFALILALIMLASLAVFFTACKEAGEDASSETKQQDEEKNEGNDDETEDPGDDDTGEKDGKAESYIAAVEYAMDLTYSDYEEYLKYSIPDDLWEFVEDETDYTYKKILKGYPDYEEWMKDRLKNLVGKHPNIKTKILDKEELDEDTVEQIAEQWDEDFDAKAKKLTQAYLLEVKLTISGEDDEESETGEWIAVCYDEVWYLCAFTEEDGVYETRPFALNVITMIINLAEESKEEDKGQEDTEHPEQEDTVSPTEDDWEDYYPTEPEYTEPTEPTEDNRQEESLSDSEAKAAIDTFVNVFFNGEEGWNLSSLAAEEIWAYYEDAYGYSYEQLSGYYDAMAMDNKEYYDSLVGEDAQTTAHVVTSVMCSEEDLAMIGSELANNYGTDPDGVTAAFLMTVELELTGANDIQTTTSTMIPYQYNGNWYVAELWEHEGQTGIYFSGAQVIDALIAYAMGLNG